MNLRERIFKFFAAGLDATERDRHQPGLKWDRSAYRSEDELIGANDRQSARQLCMDARRNNPLAAALSRCFRENVVATGIHPQAKTESADWNQQAEAWFREWEKIADVRGRVNLAGLQNLCVDARLFQGDIAFELSSGGQLNPIEGERIQTPAKLKDKRNIIEGIAISPDTGRPVAFYVFNRNDKGRIDVESNDYYEIPASNIFYVPLEPYRLDAMRPLPEIVPALQTLRYLNRINIATLEKAEMDANFGWALFTDGQRAGPGNLGPRGSGLAGAGDSTLRQKVERGTIQYFGTADRMESFESRTPNQQYKEFRLMNQREVGACVGLPLEFLMRYFADTTFSASKAALLQAYTTFHSRQIWLTETFLQRVWNWRIAKAIKARELLQAPLDGRGVSQWYRVEWSYPEFEWVDPQGVATANLQEWQLATNTITQMVRKKGRDIEDVMEEKANEILIAQKQADRMNKQVPGAAFTWRDIISAQIPGQTQASGTHEATTTGE